jgi:hypothetical protein
VEYGVDGRLVGKLYDIIEVVAYHGQSHDSAKHPEKSAHTGTGLHICPRKKGLR